MIHLPLEVLHCCTTTWQKESIFEAYSFRCNSLKYFACRSVGISQALNQMNQVKWALQVNGSETLQCGSSLSFPRRCAGRFDCFTL